MLPKKERLSRTEFNRFFSSGTRLHSKLFTVVYTPTPLLHASVVVSKKVAGKAVVRNKIRRRVYDILRNLRQREALTGTFIVLTKGEVVTAPYEVLKSEITELARKALKVR